MQRLVVTTVGENTPEGGDGAGHALKRYFSVVPLLQEVVVFALHTVETITRDHFPPRFEKRSQKRHAVLYRDYSRFSIVQGQRERRLQETAQLRDDGKKGIPVAADHIEVVHVAAVMAAAECALHILVQFIEIDVGEELRCEVANGQSRSLRTVEETFVMRQAVPFGQLPHDTAAGGGVKQDYLAGEVFDEVHIQPVSPQDRHVGEDAVDGHAPQRGEADVEQPLTVDVHEVAAYVHLEDEAGARVIATLAAYVLFEAAYAVMRAASRDAGIGVGDESPFVQFAGVVVVEVVDDAVAKVGGEHLAFFRVGDNEAGARTGLVGSVPQFVRERLQVTSEVSFESLYIGFTAFMPFRIKESVMHISGEPGIIKMIHRSVLNNPHQPHR